MRSEVVCHQINNREPERNPRYLAKIIASFSPFTDTVSADIYKFVKMAKFAYYSVRTASLNC